MVLFIQLDEMRGKCSYPDKTNFFVAISEGIQIQVILVQCKAKKVKKKKRTQKTEGFISLMYLSSNTITRLMGLYIESLSQAWAPGSGTVAVSIIHAELSFTDSQIGTVVH